MTIEPLDGGRRARITLDWQDPRPISDKNPLISSRVDIGVFADNGVHDSAPAILSWYFPPEELRRYATGPDGAPRIESIDYASPERAGTYVDPMLLPRAAWRDDYAYAADGTPLGWTRTRAGGGTDGYTPSGDRILLRTADGTPRRAAAVAYPLRRTADGTLVVEERDAGRLVGFGPGPP